MNSPEGKRLDAVLSAQDLDHRILDAFPTFKAALRFMQYQDAQSRKGIEGIVNPNIQTQGRTTILRGSTLAAVGGANGSSPAGADIELGQMINVARHGKKWDISPRDQTIGYNDQTSLETNARRELVTYLSGKYLTETWSKFDEGENVRGRSVTELIAQSREQPGTINSPELERQVNSLRQWQVPMDSLFTKRALEWMGIKEGIDYIIEDDPIYADATNHWKKRVRFISDLPDLRDRIATLPSEPPKS